MKNITFNEDLWADPIATPAPHKARKTTKKQTPKLSPLAQASVDMSAALEIGLFEYVEHPVTHQSILFYACFNSLVKDYGWFPTRIATWGKVEKLMINKNKRNAELSYGR